MMASVFFLLSVRSLELGIKKKIQKKKQAPHAKHGLTVNQQRDPSQFHTSLPQEDEAFSLFHPDNNNMAGRELSGITNDKHESPGSIFVLTQQSVGLFFAGGGGVGVGG